MKLKKLKVRKKKKKKIPFNSENLFLIIYFFFKKKKQRLSQQRNSINYYKGSNTEITRKQSNYPCTFDEIII